MIEHYLKRGYPFKQLKKITCLEAANSCKMNCRTTKPKETISTPIMTTKYNPNIQGIIHNKLKQQ